MPERVEARLQALLRDDPGHIYSDDELDAIEEVDPEMALRIARVQHFATQRDSQASVDEDVDAADVDAALAEARRILAQDGGDIELVEIKDRVVTVRLKGACVGCPNATLDLKNVVERLVKGRAPGVRQIVNVF